MKLFVLRLDGKPYTFRTLDDATAVALVLRIQKPKSHITLKRMTLPAL